MIVVKEFEKIDTGKENEKASRVILASLRKNVLCVVGIEEREVHLRPVLTLQHELISKDLCALENRFSEHDIHYTLPFFVGQGAVKLR